MELNNHDEKALLEKMKNFRPVRAFSRCAQCDRPLKNPKSLEIGMGPVCARRRNAALARQDDQRNIAELPFDPISGDIVCQRVGRKTLFNISQAITYHSPTGMEWGYSGSGPADFALNILNWYMPPARKVSISTPGHEHKTAAGTYITSVFAMRYHQEFKQRFIAGLPEAGGTIPGEEIRLFIAEKLEEIRQAQLALPIEED